MDIHKPKPWHGVREFLKEYLIIVIGVLTALGGEAVVQGLHVQSEVREARAAIHAEMRADLRKLVLQQRDYACYASRMAAVAAWARGEAPKPATGIGPFLGGLGSNAWDTAKTGAVPHMALEERLALGDFYGGVDSRRTLMGMLREQANALAGYLDRDSLDPEEAHDLVRLAGQVRAYLPAAIGSVPPLLALGRRLGVEPGPPDPASEAEVDRLCAAYPPQQPAGSR
jgi:hypothetical protein